VAGGVNGPGALREPKRNAAQRLMAARTRLAGTVESGRPARTASDCPTFQKNGVRPRSR
jgi:hypothetical protein